MTTEPRGRGRPPLSPRSPTWHAMVRFPAHWRGKLAYEANRRGLSIAGYIRRLVADALGYAHTDYDKEGKSV